MGRVNWINREPKIVDEPGFNEKDLDELADSMKARVLSQGGEMEDSIGVWKDHFWRYNELRPVGKFAEMYIKKLEEKADV